MRDLEARLEQVAHENAQLGDALQALNTNARQNLNLLTAYIVSLRHVLLERGLLSTEDLATIGEIAGLEAMLGDRDRGDTTETTR